MYWILKIQCQKSLWFKYCSFFGSLMLGVFNTDWFVRILFSDFNQTFHFYFNLGELVYENSIVSWSPVNVQHYLFHQKTQHSRILCNENENFQFLKNNFFLLLHFHLLMILHTILLKSMIFLKFWPLMTFFGLHWPFWPLWPWMIF